jgi:hypothetical protein
MSPSTTIANTQPMTTATISEKLIYNPNTDMLFRNEEEKNEWLKLWKQYEVIDEGLPYIHSNINNALQNNSTLYGFNNSNVGVNMSRGYGNWATIDELGKSMTDTLGGIKSDLGYAILEEQLGTFDTSGNNNPNTYNNMQDYVTGVDTNNLSTKDKTNDKYHYIGPNNPPIILQKDFDGVANIFAPNIYISDKVLQNDGFPNISYPLITRDF